MKKIGIVGGVGPEASNAFCEMLIKNKSVKNDQDHIPFIHFSNPQIPDRTDYIIGKGENPTQEIINTCQVLENAGADFLVIPCNTAHYFLREIQENITIPIVDMTKVLVKKIAKEEPPIKKIGILATTGSIKAQIYQNYFKKVGVETILPSEKDQEEIVMDAIYGQKGIKAGNKTSSKIKLMIAAQDLINRGAEALVLGCTEIPLVLEQKDFDVKLYDPMDIASKEIIKYVEKEIEKEEVVTVKYVLEEIAINIQTKTINSEKDITAIAE
jgi:aspartate racemase